VCLFCKQPSFLPAKYQSSTKKEKEKMAAESATAIPRGQVSIFFVLFV